MNQKMTTDEAVECMRAIHVQMFNTGNSKWTKALDMAINALETAEKYKWHDLRNDPEDFPEERDSIFAKYYGTEKWHSSFFRKVSDEVMVCFLAPTGERIIKQVQSHDGRFNFPYPSLDDMRAIAWRFIEPFATDTNVGDKEEEQ